MIYWFVIPLILISVGAIFSIVRRHWKEIRLLNPESIKEERVRKARGQIIERRFQRIKADQLTPLKILAHRSIFAGKKQFHAAYLKLLQINSFYKQLQTPLANIAPSKQERLKVLLDEARSLARDLKWADAERRFLEVLGLDSRNAEAYKGLALIYVKQKLYDQAHETFNFLVKSKRADDVCFAGLAEIAEAKNDLANAEAMYQQALEARPKMAHWHAELAEFYLRHDNAGQAWPLAKKAAEFEPRSAKYMELSLEAALRAGKRDEARRRYDKLRLLSEDKVKLQALKERIDELVKIQDTTV